jgi:hypothetical protein
MSTSLAAYAKGGNLPSIDKDAMARALSQASNEESTGSASDGVEYVAFSGKTGAITYGRDRDDLDQDEIFLMEPRSAFRGWICWKDNKPVARHQWSVYQPEMAIPERELEDKGPYARAQDGWQSMLGFGFMSTESEEVVQYSFSTNSVSGKNAVGDLFNEIAERTMRGEPNFPLFRFTREKFQAQGEWNFKPKFDIDEWITEAEAAEMLGGAAEAEPEQEEVTPEPEPEPEAPKRTRRQRRT